MDNTTIHYAFLPHLDPEASLAFYRDLIGLEIRNDVGYGDMRWITLGSPGQPETSIVLEPPFADPSISEEERKVVLAMMAKGTFGRLTFATSDLDGLFERLAGGGADIVQEPMDQDYGVRDAAVRDPSGNLLRINQL